MQRGPCLRHLLMGLHADSRAHNSVETHSTWVWDTAALTHIKSSGTFGCKKKKKRIENLLEYLKDSAKIEVP